ncbi:MAG: adenylosuccinate synthetase [Clostridia bacterium]|nr:adenylosuccinate synthetase [Clostridia bacterium]
MIYSVIGSNYGDEGKGLMTDYLAALKPSTLVIRHNGGAQSGHTVEFEDKRFIFHELSSGSVRGADTYWADTFYPDLYKFNEEIESFLGVIGKKSLPFSIYASPSTCITTIDDIFCNMLRESLRGNNRHGSCGMGIFEAVLRCRAGYKVCIGELFKMNADTLSQRLAEIRHDYVIPHINEILKEFNLVLENVDLKSLNPSAAEYLDLLTSDDVLYNFAQGVIDNLKYIKLKKPSVDFLTKYDNVIFETGQGLYLDAECKESFPHVTASKTGLYNPVKFLDYLGLQLDEAVYVTRTYMTKHGAGPFADEDRNLFFPDETNIRNNWQGSIRFGRFTSIDSLISRINNDLKTADYRPAVALAVTHLNETDNCLLTANGGIEIDEFVREPLVTENIDKMYLSSSKYADQTVKTQLRNCI